jgi:hypothetical protein
MEIKTKEYRIARNLKCGRNFAPTLSKVHGFEFSVPKIFF